MRDIECITDCIGPDCEGCAHKKVNSKEYCDCGKKNLKSQPVISGTLHARDELVKSIHNRCCIYRKLRTLADDGEIESWIPTLLEDNYRDGQELLEDFCVVREP